MGLVARKKTSFIVDTGATFSFNFLLWPNLRLRTHNQGGLWSSPKAKNQPSITLSVWKIDPYTLIPHNASMPDGTPRETFVIQIGGLYYHTPPRYSLYILHADGTWTVPVPHPDLPLHLPTSDPQVWDTHHPSIAKHHPPVHITLKDPSTIITQQQYSLTLEALKPIIDRLLQASILIPTHSPYNTPILAVRKGPGSGPGSRTRICESQ